MSRFDTIMDGRELFAQLAEKVARGELIITHFMANTPKYSIRGEMFTAQSAGAKLDMRVTAVENTSLDGLPPPPIQVRELIFDGPAEPIYDEDLK